MYFYKHVILLVLLHLINAGSQGIYFEYPRDRYQYRCVVGIGINDIPVGVGTLLAGYWVVTSANPFYMLHENRFGNNSIVTPSELEHKITVHAAQGRILTVEYFYTARKERKDAWVQVGVFQQHHTTIHDILFIKLLNRQALGSAYLLDDKFKADALSWGYEWMVAGFGYTSLTHLHDNNQLVIKYYLDSDQVNCDEWIPRAWGRFLCFRKLDTEVGVQSGSPLFKFKYLRGIGLFSVKRENSTVLVFTQFDLYAKTITSGS